MIVAVKDLGEVDNDYFLIPVSIRDHEGPLVSSFPVENRLLPQGAPFRLQYFKVLSGQGRMLEVVLCVTPGVTHAISGQLHGLRPNRKALYQAIAWKR